MEKAERKERPERSEREIKEAKLNKRKPGPKPRESGVFDQHFSMRMGLEHLDVLDRIGAKGGNSRGEVIRSMIMEFGKRLEAQGKI